MLQPTVLETLTQRLAQEEKLDFALLFGSQHTGQAMEISDVDLAVYFREKPDLIALGHLYGDLEEIVGKRLDLVQLRGLEQENPPLAKEITDHHTLLFCRDEESYVDFKTRAMLWYFDTAPLRAMFDKAMLNHE